MVRGMIQTNLANLALLNPIPSPYLREVPLQSIHCIITEVILLHWKLETVLSYPERILHEAGPNSPSYTLKPWEKGSLTVCHFSHCESTGRDLTRSGIHSISPLWGLPESDIKQIN